MHHRGSVVLSRCAALQERCPPRPKSRVERLKAKVEPLFTSVKVEIFAGAGEAGTGIAELIAEAVAAEDPSLTLSQVISFS